MIEELVRKNIKKLKPYTSARDSYLEGILMDANENSIGSVVKDEHNLNLNRYPDPSQIELRTSLSKYLKVEPSKLFFGVGSDEIIDLLIRIFCDPRKDSVLIPLPTYGMYQVACEVNDVEVLTVPLNRNFQVDLNKTLNAIQENTKIIFLCSPNNPTGNLLNKKSVIQLIKKFNGIVVIDEAYIDFSEDYSFIKEIDEYRHLVVLRTFSKAWGLAGIRCGYSIADEFITNLLFKIKAPYNINKLTAHSILDGIKSVGRKDKFVSKLNSEKDKLIEELKKIKKVKKILRTDANFITFKIDNAKDVFNHLASEGVIIRDRSNQLNLQNCLRVSIGTPQENKRFINKLKEINE